METLFDILKIVLPALIVFATAYYLLKQLTDNQVRLQAMKQQSDRSAVTLPLRLQAYERLSLFCERIAIENLLLRVKAQGMNAGQYKVALLIAIQQEFEHNVTQQVYVSNQLWQIIQIARDDLSRFIDLVSEKVDRTASAAEFAEQLLAYAAQRDENPLPSARAAIQKEAGSLF